jgi:hypothetical protein
LSSLEHRSLDALLNQYVKFDSQTFRILEYSPVTGDCIDLRLGKLIGVFAKLLQTLAVVRRA